MMNEYLDLHKENCCILHGCKYRNFDCPISLGILPSNYPCRCNLLNIRSFEMVDEC